MGRALVVSMGEFGIKSKGIYGFLDLPPSLIKSTKYPHQHFKVARYSFSGSLPPKFEHKLRRHKQRFGKIATTVDLDKDENLL